MPGNPSKKPLTDVLNHISGNTHNTSGHHVNLNRSDYLSKPNSSTKSDISDDDNEEPPSSGSSKENAKGKRNPSPYHDDTSSAGDNTEGSQKDDKVNIQITPDINNDNSDTKPPNFGLSKYMFPDPSRLWREDNYNAEYFPPIYPANDELSARNLPPLEKLPDLAVNPYLHFEIYDSYLFPKEVRKAYEDKVTKMHHWALSNPNYPEKYKSKYTYNGDEMCVPECHIPYLYYIVTKSMSETQYVEFCKTVKDMEAESISKMTHEERAYFDKWARFYNDASAHQYVRITSFGDGDGHSHHYINNYYTDSTIEFISHLDCIKRITLRFWGSVFNKPAGFH